MASQNINLFQAKTTVQPIFSFIERSVKIVALSLLSVVVSGSLMVALSFYVFGQQKDTMEAEKQQFLSRIKEYVAKESLLVMMRNRLVAVDKIVATQVAYAPYIDTTMKIIQSFSLTSFSLDPKNAVSISVSVTTMDEAMGVLKTLMDMEQRKEITTPILQSFVMDKETIKIGLSYFVVL
jgi:hypothetical protein